MKLATQSIKDSFWMSAALQLAKGKSRCLRRDVGAVVVKRGKLLGVGVNGTRLCQERGCMRSASLSGRELHKCRGSHSEVRALFNVKDIDLSDAILYITHSPCSHCAPVIVERGIKTIVYQEPYGDYNLASEILKEAGVEIRRCKDEFSK